MRLPGAFSTLFLLFLSLSSALPVHAVLTLTTDDFDKTVAQGYWFIEHFSPWCHHCKEFRPTWEKLADTAPATDDLKHVKFAQVNCATHGDLCDAHNVKGYPQMNLYNDGKFVKTFKGIREIDLLTTFLKDNAPKPTVATPETPSSSPAAEPEAIRQPTRPPPPKVNLEGTLISLSASNFQDTLEQGPTFVKFYAPWCGHCKKLAPTWTQLARHMQGKMNVAEVNCDDNGSLCSKNGVQGYPTLIYFQNGISSEYNGGRKFEQLREFAEVVSAPPVVAIQPSEIYKTITEKDVAFILVQSKYDDSVARDVDKASTSLFGAAPVYSVVSPTLLSENHITSPFAILAYKSQTVTAHTTSTTKLGEWMLANSLPPSLELTQDTFQRVMNAAHRPLVVVAAVTKSNRDTVASKMREIGKKWLVHAGKSDKVSKKDVVFAWMDAGKWEKWMKNMYGINASDGTTPIVIANHADLVYYDTDAYGKPLQLAGPRLFEALEAQAEGKLKAKHSENLLERFARYTSMQLIRGEAYVVSHPLQAAAFVMTAGAIVFWLLKKWLSVEDLDAEHGHGHGPYGHVPSKKGARLD